MCVLSPNSQANSCSQGSERELPCFFTVFVLDRGVIIIEEVLCVGEAAVVVAHDPIKSHSRSFGAS